MTLDEINDLINACGEAVINYERIGDKSQYITMINAQKALQDAIMQYGCESASEAFTMGEKAALKNQGVI